MAYLIIGYVLVFFRFAINGFDLLPDGLGYILIMAGLTKLDGNSDKLAKAKPWAISMVVIEFLLSVGVFLNIHIGGAMAVIINLLTLLITLYLSYLIVAGIQDIELMNNVKIGASNLMLIWKIGAVLLIACKVLVFIPFDMMALILSALTFTAIATNIIFLVFLYKVKKMCDDINS